MTGADTIACYERVLSIMERMHAAAAAAEWDRLMELEHGCRAVVARLMAEEPGEPLGPALQQHKGQLIRQVLALDAAIRNITEPHLRQLQAFLGARQRERNLHRAYGAPDGV